MIKVILKSKNMDIMHKLTSTRLIVSKLTNGSHKRISSQLAIDSFDSNVVLLIMIAISRIGLSFSSGLLVYMTKQYPRLDQSGISVEKVADMMSLDRQRCLLSTLNTLSTPHVTFSQILLCQVMLCNNSLINNSLS